MKTTPVSTADLRRSVMAVPPLARDRRMNLDHHANRALLRYLEDGGVSAVLYGGNANLYNIGAAQYRELLDGLPTWVGENTWVIPSIGPSYGQMMDQLEVLQDFDYPTVMALPLTAPATRQGTEDGLRRVAERFGAGIVLYLKWDGYLDVEQVAALVEDQTVCAIKYAVVREDPAQDPFLRALVERIGSERIVSGIGERPAITHLRDFGLPAFTSGSVCVGPRQSTALLRALQDGELERAEALRARFLPLEDLRDGVHPIRVLHDAVSEAGIADMGPILPLLSNLEPEVRARVAEAARALTASERDAA